MRSSCFVFVLLALASTSVLGFKEEKGVTKFIPLGDKHMKKIVTVDHLTRTLMNSIQTHDFARILTFIDKYSRILTHSLLPTSGYYQGKRGFALLAERMTRMVVIKDANYHIRFVDEVRGISVVETRKAGVFNNNNASFDDCRSMLFIKWGLGKISKLHIVDANPEKIYSLFLTKAHKQWNKLMSTMYKCGGCDEVNKYIADDVTLNFKNIYPIAFFSGIQDDQNVTGDLNVLLKGRENLKKFANFAAKTYFNMTAKIKVLYSDDTTVVAAKILKPTTHLFLPTTEKMYWENVGIMYTIDKFNDKGELKDVTVLYNRPFEPYEIRYINELLENSGEPSLLSLIAPLRSAFSITAAPASSV